MSQIMRPMADCQRESCGARVVRVSGFPALPPRDRLADMKSSLLLAGATLAALILSPIVSAQSPEPGNLLASVDGSDLARQMQAREDKITKLSIEEQTTLRAAQKLAVQDPAVKAALAERDKAVSEFETAVLASMVKSDPGIPAILEKMKAGTQQGR